MIRSLTVWLMFKTGFRFSKDYRWGTTAWHRFIYSRMNTVRLNLSAYHLEDEAQRAKGGDL